jgi:ATP-dependent exoDNAse (exonuclease V) alpha subunit
LAAPAGAGKTTSLRALRATARDFYNRRVLVLAPTGHAVDVAVRQGAGDTGMTIAKALNDLRESRLRLHPNTLVIVDEAAMVGTSELRELLAATSAAGVKTVLVGDAHQLAPVRARGGMFAQFCADLPWAQQLCEVWRMRDPEERSASLALRDGGPAPRRRAIDWYRTHRRLHAGDPVTMAHDVGNAYAADINAGKDALLVCDTTEMCDALNRRIHDAKVAADAPTVTAARGQRIAVGDLIISRRNDATMRIYQAERDVPAADPVRNGNRWQVAAVDADRNRIAARRLSDGARAVFDGDYVREHITHGYAVTVHAAQGVTADTTHAVLGENTARAALYVAMTRGREANHVYLYERSAEASEYSDAGPNGLHVLRRASGRAAAQLFRHIIATDARPRTAHELAAETGPERLPTRVAELLIDPRTHTVQTRRAAYRHWCSTAQQRSAGHQHSTDQHLHQSRDYSLEL